jgi:hypothetical protein
MKDLLKYGKAKGIVLLQKYLPQISPFKSVDIVSTVDEWNAVKEKYGDFVPHRVDMPIGEPRKNVVQGTNGFSNSIPDLIKKVNEQSPNGVVLLMATKEQAVRRYENDGGFNILFNMGESIIIELVGKGFDGHELTQGLAIHERYQIPWNEILFMRDRVDLLKSPTVAKACVTPDCYAKQRNERVKFLNDICHYDIDKINEHIPQQYKLIDNDIIRQILDDVVLELMKQQSSLKKDGLKRFGVQGNLLHGQVQPWEIFRAERLVTKDIAKDIDKER